MAAIVTEIGALDLNVSQRAYQAEEDYRLRSSCRPASLARMRERAGASSALGWPDNGRDGFLQAKNPVVAAGAPV